MLFDISDLAPGGVAVDATVPIPPFLWEGGQMIACAPARLTGHLRPTSRGVELRGRYDTKAQLVCDRCLTRFDLPLEGEFRLFLVPQIGPEEAEEFERRAEEDPDAVDLYPLEGQVVDLAEVLREQVDLALPYRAICREDCPGLCPGCGADGTKNEPCRCSTGPTDDRWSELARLKAELERRKGETPSEGR
ncbi:MAG: DUF177 domain-containing protein [Acidobacteria bacterium]|jgi:uncharacterized protein|nr:DUF177 domain-containing protein [Acidobacteriota bacterium]MCU0253413.1 DUF177 domain-containing protein [Acidobacteriota bacterium]